MAKIERLVKYFQPENYQLELDLQRLARRFSGKVIITGKLASLSTPIKLHAKELKISGALVNDIPAEVEKLANDEIRLIPDSRPFRRKVTLTLEFSGKITDQMNGLYPCYFKHNGKSKELLATQFESHSAREVFPCLDEPNAKATFDLTLQTEKNVTVLGNMPIKQQASQKESMLSAFQTTPKMSTYLLAFVVGELHNAKGSTKDGIEVKIWATPTQTRTSLVFALNTAIDCIEFFSDYFGVTYPLPKSDHVALPDFSAGAMENWGLITYREACLVVEPEAAASTKQMVATVIAHETSHQWFGNLVTMKWWDDLWLNESFATLMEYIALDHLFPEWEVWLDFAAREKLPALRRDSVKGVQAIKTEVGHPAEINSLFDGAIVYAKGGSVLRMLRAHIGEAAFKVGLKKYFAKFAYQNTAGGDLWRVLEQASKRDITAFITPWLQQSGFPVVSVSQSGKRLSLSQRQFLIGTGTSGKKSWPIPLFAGGALKTEPLLVSPSKTINNQDKSGPKLNMGDRAHFITRYSLALHASIIKKIEAGKLEPIERLQLLHEATLLQKALMQPSVDTISLLEAYKNETSQPVWDIIGLAISDFKRFVETDVLAEDGLKWLTANLAAKPYHKLGWRETNNEAQATTKLRANVIAAMLYAEDKTAIAKALTLYHKSDDISQLSGELRGLILSAAVKHSDDPKIIDKLLDYHAKTASSDIRQDISQAMCATRDQTIAKRLLGLLTDSSVIRPQDVPRWFGGLTQNRHTRDLAWNWLVEKWPWIRQTFGQSPTYDTFPKYCAAYFNNKADLARFKSFFEPMKREPALNRTITVGAREIEARLNWLEHDQAAVHDRLKAGFKK